MNHGPMDVYIDSAPENFVPELALKAEYVLEERWNGWLQPVATAEAFGAFLDAWRANDPNGVWGYATEVGDVLMVTRTDSDEYDDYFGRVGETADGTPLYNLSGWVWCFGDDLDAG